LNNGDQNGAPAGSGSDVPPPPDEAVTASVPAVDLSLGAEDVSVAPLPLRAGLPFTLTTVIRNNHGAPAVDVPIMVHMSAKREDIGYSPYLEVLTATLPASQSIPVQLPIHWNFAGGEHQIWIQVNRLPDAWQAETPTQPEDDLTDNIVLLELMVDPFDAYGSDLCSGRADVEIGPADVLPEPDRQQVLVRIHNLGNQAVYNLPVVVSGERLTGIAYSPAIPPCGGTGMVFVPLDRPLEEGESLTVEVNPGQWANGLIEDDFGNNRVTVTAGLPPGVIAPPGSGLDDYDFGISSSDIETPALWIVVVKVHNLGMRDADMVPILVENTAGREILDYVPLVQGEGLGVVALRVGYLWNHGETLTFTVNPEGAKGTYPEKSREDNVATFTLP
jgi:hypothetical protein